MDTLSSPSAKLTATGEHRREEDLQHLDLEMDTLSSSLSAKLTTPGDEHQHRREEELRKGRLLLFVLLAVNSALVMYILRGDLVSVASVGVTYLAVGLLLARRFGCWEPRFDGAGTRRLLYAIWFLAVSLTVLELLRESRLPRIRASSPSSAPMLVAAAGAAALVVGGGCAYLLRRRSWSKDQRQEAIIFLPLRQDPRSLLDISRLHCNEI